MPTDWFPNVAGASSPASGLCTPKLFYSGSGAPTCEAFPDGVYQDTSTGDFYEAADGAWVLTQEGGGGAESERRVFSGDYAGGVPTDIPIASEAIGIDTSNGTKWYWYNGVWN